MRVLFDLTFVDPKSFSGVVIYALRLLKGFQESEKKNDIILLVTEKNIDFIKKECNAFQSISIQIKKSVLLTRFYFLTGYIHKNTINKIIKKNNISLFFSPFLQIGGLFTNIIPQVGVLHDAQGYILSKNNGSKGLVYRFFMSRLLNKIKEIVTISNFSKHSILKEISSLQTSISVIYNSVETPTVKKNITFINHDPYILYINTLMPYKNLETLVRAFAILKDSINHKLIIKAKELPYWHKTIMPLLNEFNIADRVFLIQEKYSDSKLASLYADADLFVTPSFMEGFGFTPIEAAMHYVPVISSKESALFETTLGLLNYYEPADDFKQLANVIDKTLINKPSKEELIKISDCFKQTYSVKQQIFFFKKLFNKYK